MDISARLYRFLFSTCMFLFCTLTLIRAQSVPIDDTLNLNRLTDQLDPNYLHDSGKSGILTANKTLWMDPTQYGNSLPTLWSLYLLDTVARNCPDMNTLRPHAVGPFLRHPATTYEPTNTVSGMQDFENLAKYPQNVRVAISWDKLPEIAGPVWSTFPSSSQWNALAPTGIVRNLKGREAAVAYREHGGEPYHYSVMSYDERGRVEALVRYTENLGFDAVYYQYNSMNQVIRLTVIDPLRRYTTWYGYDHNGRVDSVWTRLENVGSGLWNAGTGVWAYNANTVNRSHIPDIRYVYTGTGQIDTMAYPRINVKTAYSYSPRKWLDTLIATKGSVDIFKQYLTFDNAGQITAQTSQQGTSTALTQSYEYDNLGQLTRWYRAPGTGSEASEHYTYDSVGNRTLLNSKNYLGQTTSWSLLDIGRRASTSAGPNQLVKNRQFAAGLGMTGYTEYGYDPDGAQNRRQLFSSGGLLQLDEQFSYSSWRGLSWKYERTNPNLIGANTWEWRYRYNAMGEREQKRETLNPGGDGTASNGYNWTYYLLGGNKQQVSVWEGLQTSDATFCGHPGTGSYVHLYPSEYLTYGGSTANLVTKPTGTSATTQEYRIADHLGSNRVVLSGSGGTVISTTDYHPFGKPLGGSPPERQSFIDKEQDVESQLGNFGVRSYDYDAGRFTSIDPLWEKYYKWSPYNYAQNNPLTLVDPGGDSIKLGETVEQTSKYVHYISQTSYGSEIFTFFNDWYPETDVEFEYKDLSDERTPDKARKKVIAKAVPQPKIDDNGALVLDDNGNPVLEKVTIYLDPNKVFNDDSHEGREIIQTIAEELWHSLQFGKDLTGTLKTSKEHYQAGKSYDSNPIEVAAKEMARSIADEISFLRSSGNLSEPLSN